MTTDVFAPGDTSHQTFTVSQLNRNVKDLLESHFPLVWVEGELSNLSRPSSGHWYFTLKDENAHISCAMFKRRNVLVTFKPAPGDHLRIRARVSLYEGRGDYQLIVEHAEQAGFGLLLKRFEELKSKLLGRGLFDSKAKVTSPTGAAIREVLAVLERRFPAMLVTILPCLVQGDEAPATIIQAIKNADEDTEFDAVLVCRGGGSIEDLWAFNNEALAHAIFDCRTPIMCAVGHEADFTIGDFVADARAPTPSAAAELLSSDQHELAEQLALYETRLRRALQGRLEKLADTLKFLELRLRHPQDKLEQWTQRLDALELRLLQSIERIRKEKSLRCQTAHERFTKSSPDRRIHEKFATLKQLHRQLSRGISLRLDTDRQNYGNLVSQLDIVSPIATLGRGYSIARDTDGKIQRSVNKIAVGAKIIVTLSDGDITSRVQDITKK